MTAFVFAFVFRVSGFTSGS